MVQKSGVHQLRLVVDPTIYRVLYIPGGAGFLNHQQYEYIWSIIPRLTPFVCLLGDLFTDSTMVHHH